MQFKYEKSEYIKLVKHQPTNFTLNSVKTNGWLLAS